MIIILVKSNSQHQSLLLLHIQQKNMAAQCRNYTQQYSKSKSIREVNKPHVSYKQLLHQNSKTRENSTATINHQIGSNNNKLSVNNNTNTNTNGSSNALRLSAYKQNNNNDNSHSLSKNKNKDNNNNNKAVDQHMLHEHQSLLQSFMTHSISNSKYNNAGQSHQRSAIKSQVQPLMNATQTLQNIDNQLSYSNKLNSKMKLKVASNSKYNNNNTNSKNTDKNIRSTSSQSQDKLIRYQNSLVVSSMANVGVGLSNSKKKPKLVTLTASHSKSSTKKSQHNINSNMNPNQSVVSHQNISQSRSHNNSILHSKYSTNLAHEAAYRSIKKDLMKTATVGDQLDDHDHDHDHDHQHQQIIQVVTLNSSMIIDDHCSNSNYVVAGANSKDSVSKRYNNHNKGNLDDVYVRVKGILSEHARQQQQWHKQRTYYQQKIRALQKQLGQHLLKSRIASFDSHNVMPINTNAQYNDGDSYQYRRNGRQNNKTHK